MERCVHKHLYNYMVTNQLLTPLQSGFVPKSLDQDQDRHVVRPGQCLNCSEMLLSDVKTLSPHRIKLRKKYKMNV